MRATAAAPLPCAKFSLLGCTYAPSSRIGLDARRPSTKDEIKHVGHMAPRWARRTYCCVRLTSPYSGISFETILRLVHHNDTGARPLATIRQHTLGSVRLPLRHMPPACICSVIMLQHHVQPWLKTHNTRLVAVKETVGFCRGIDTPSTQERGVVKSRLSGGSL